MKSDLLAAASLAALFAAHPARAQDAAPVDESEEAIVVTAQYREQDPVEVPFALTAYSGDQLGTLGIEEFEELSEFVPGFEVQSQSPNNSGFVMRGITSDSGDAFTEPRVSVFQDGVSISKSRGSYVELFDVERVEIAKGPQSTLYGRGALIGAVNIVQNKADPDAGDFAARAYYGNFNAWLGEAMINAPMGDKAALRVSGRAKHRDGYVENLLGGDDFASTDTWAIRGALRAEPSERITLDVIANYQRDNPTGTSFKSLNFNPTDPATGTVLGGRDADDGAALRASNGFADGTRLGLDREVFGVTGLAAIELSGTLTLNAITAYREFDALEVFDADGISLPLLTVAEDAVGEQFSQELRLGFDNGGAISGFVGASYFKEKGSVRVPFQFDERIALAQLVGVLNGPAALGRPATDPAPISLFGSTAFTGALLQAVAGARGVALPATQAQAIAANLKFDHRESYTNAATTEAFDIFGDVTVRLSEQFEIGAGLRYTRDDKSSSISSAVLNGRSILGGFIGALTQPAPVRSALLGALTVPGAANIPQSAAYPVPLFGLFAQPTAGNGATVSDDLTNDGFAWRLTARYAPNADSSLYATYARGRRPQVLESTAPATPFGAPNFLVVDAETVDSFEVGAKTAIGRALYVDAALFYYSYDNFQTTVQQGLELVTANAGEAQAYGLETQFRWTPSPWLRLFGNYAYNHSRFRTGARDGNRFRLSPDHSAALGATFSADLGDGRIAFTPSVTYQSRVFFDDDNDRPDLQADALVPDLIVDELQDGYALINARLGYTFDSGLGVEMFVDNLFDESYIKDAGNVGDNLGLPTFIAGEPRIYGIQASVRF